MKKIALIIFIVFCFFFSLIFILNIKVTTRQGINYKVSTLRIPLYLKMLDFYDRHYNYKCLVSRIIQGKNSPEEKIMTIFRWTTENIMEQPKELPVFDDHVWHIIVRGYGTGDQFSDVFTTLCNYANFDAFFYRLANKEKSSVITVSFVKLDKGWSIFEPRAGVYFVNHENNFASVEDIAKGDYSEINIKKFGDSQLNYRDYFERILSINFAGAHRFSRANIQSPIKRVIYEIKDRLKIWK